jgi:hypothetical protein
MVEQYLTFIYRGLCQDTENIRRALQEADPRPDAMVQLCEAVQVGPVWAFTSFKVVLIVKMDRLISFRHLADCAERFIRAYATNLDKAGARDDLLLHFTNLGLAGMIKVEEQAKCMRLYDRLVAEAKMAMED